jgi:hypothetical protein
VVIDASADIGVDTPPGTIARHPSSCAGHDRRPRLDPHAVDTVWSLLVDQADTRALLSSAKIASAAPQESSIKPVGTGQVQVADHVNEAAMLVSETPTWSSSPLTHREL